jgi:hypothetical protein
MDTIANFIENHPNILSDAILPAVVAIVSALWAWVRKNEKLQAWKLTKAMECLEAGVQNAYDEYVRAIKLASEDGKLTEEERRNARTLAIDSAKAYAKNYGIDLVKELGAEMLPKLIEGILSKFKKAETVVIPVVAKDDPAPEVSQTITMPEVL